MLFPALAIFIIFMSGRELLPSISVIARSCEHGTFTAKSEHRELDRDLHVLHRRGGMAAVLRSVHLAAVQAVASPPSVQKAEKTAVRTSWPVKAPGVSAEGQAPSRAQLL
ncbi:hypothetical protein [Actinomadura rudentiformis]|uniref:Uncharacterized protein n=1 Tax=Actinomadura rudentiformis TaxID=359158 RepID=A0A6H9YFV8_9ACTN|nr:hypothetical protein [Actinomadura rudentiformis]KAB2344448.1 hypothetical protein F8566_31465 [Actinomadura rudentiformis]